MNSSNWFIVRTKSNVQLPQLCSGWPIIVVLICFLVADGYCIQVPRYNNLPASTKEDIFDWRAHEITEIELVSWNWNGLSLLEFPRNSDMFYINNVRFSYACVKGGDTLVSSGYYNYLRGGETRSYVPVTRQSASPVDPDFSPDAVADVQLYSECSDTAVLNTMYPDIVELRPHKPIGIEVHQTTYAWSGGVGRRFILVNWWIKNITNTTLPEGYAGLYIFPGVRYRGSDFDGDIAELGDNDDQCGFLKVAPGIVDGTLDTVMMAWFADNDGQPLGSPPSFTRFSPTGVAGVRILRAPPGGRISFNWWQHGLWTDYVPDSWGPSLRSNVSGYFGQFGLPVGDRGDYRMMGNGEIDYDQMYAAQDMWTEGWRRPKRDGGGEDIANGDRVVACLSYGPVPPIPPGDSIPLTAAFVAGSGFHRDPLNFMTNFNPYDVREYRNRLDFSDLIHNARWASWVFDNPGVDTDGNGDRGAAYLTDCGPGGCDSVFYRGDGVPDFRGPSPPPAPAFDIVTTPGAVTLRWEGARTESAVDPFSLQRDFEGYRVYVGKFDLDDQYSLIASWDREDYVRLEYHPETGSWEQISYALTPAEWQLTLGDDTFHPQDYAEPVPERAYTDSVTDTTFDVLGQIVRITTRERRSYWTPESLNRGNVYMEMGSTETNIIQRVADRDTIIDGEPLTYGVYEVTIDRLNPGVPLFCAVTAFDFGDYRSGMEPLESSPSANSRYFEPIYSTDVVIDSGLKVQVFPNPYKLAYRDGHGTVTSYFREGYEGRGVEEFAEQDRRIHFINLPDTATISIYTLDGDLVRRIHHPDPFLTTYPSSVGWDLVTRNVQAAVSGIYIWKVDSRLGSQVGKLVIIK